MKIQINNFGPVKQYEFDLCKDLHLIFGGNNIGKSYAITIVYLVIKSILSYASPLISYHLEKFYSFDIQETPGSDMELEHIKKSVLENLTSWMYGTIIQSFYESLLATYDSIENLQNQFTNDEFSIVLSSEIFILTIKIEKGRLLISNIELKKELEVRAVKRNRHCKFDRNKIIFYYVEDSETSYHAHIRELTILLYQHLINEIASRIESVHFLPASRSGLYQALNAFGQIIAELSKSRSFLKKKIELPNISEPLSDYFLNLTEITIGRRTVINKEISDIAKQIETDILKGTVEFDSKTKRIMFSPENTKLRLDLSSTSSMVSELSPIVSFIRYILAQPSRRTRQLHRSAKPLVIIEEPEAHLHPKIQTIIMEIFSKLVSNNVKIIITSHSNYIFSKANNLILDGKINIDALQATIFKSNAHGSVGENIDTDTLGMNDENFIDISEQLLNEKINLINKANCDD